MTIEKEKSGQTLHVTLEGRLDTTTAPQLDEFLKLELTEITELTFDFKDLIYVSSAGLRVILMTQKKMNAAKGTMIIHNVNDVIMEVFEATGFVDILTIE